MTATSSPFRVAPAMDAVRFEAVRRELILNGCKWDPQVGDVSTLAAWPLVLKAEVWKQLAGWAEQLTAESLTAEQEMLARDDGPWLWRRLGLPWRIRPAFGDGLSAGFTPTAARIVRYDFHWTTDGWRISEANTDVPGGFAEAGAFSALVAEQYPETRTAGDPSAAWAEVASRAGGVAALVSAPGFMEDHQVISYLAMELRKHGMVAHLADLQQLRWSEGIASLDTAWHRGPLDLIVRFYQAEWLPRSKGGWPLLIRGGRTAVTNPVTALLVESKRFPLVWDELRTALPTWRRLLPETRGVYEAPWRTDDGWLLKSALCNNGDTVSMRSILTARQWRSASIAAMLQPINWLAQRRFEAVAIETPDGPRYPCIGVYTVNGRAIGAYGRVGAKPMVDYEAVDVAVLVEREGVSA